jgi:hypothetical protein
MTRSFIFAHCLLQRRNQITEINWTMESKPKTSSNLQTNPDRSFDD